MQYISTFQFYSWNAEKTIAKSIAISYQLSKFVIYVNE